MENIFTKSSKTQESRLFKLPAELRVQIFKDALTYPEGISWYWESWDSRPRVGSFRRSVDHGHANPLSLTCRQLYQETNMLHLELNTLDFDGDNVDIPMAPDDTDTEWNEWAISLVCYNHFLACSKSWMLERIPAVNLHVLIFDIDLDFELTQLRFPNMGATLKIICGNFLLWRVSESPSCFLSTGRRIQDKLWLMESNQSRKWRLFPYTPDKEMAIQEIRMYIPPQHVAMAIGWVENGL
ncbi:hypothetical protein BDV96DRAFT_653451 [Lophiotrema nucula]|uniref:F-box domain-containing protein n=1 Tax=Lophiotrema nucula TaxID=690887 RepID=A0A6A5YKY4_9PLEO|nr:hypothetical protein BDV96DRAFT_653451 [Lophiotrema nucula]